MNSVKLMKYTLRILNIIISCTAAYLTYDFIYDRYLSYLPAKKFLNLINDPANGSLGVALRENTVGFRELYFHAFEKSIIFSIIAFLLSFLIIEYVYRSMHKPRENAIKSVYEALGAFKERNKNQNDQINN